LLAAFFIWLIISSAYASTWASSYGASSFSTTATGLTISFTTGFCYTKTLDEVGDFLPVGSLGPLLVGLLSLLATTGAGLGAGSYISI